MEKTLLFNLQRFSLHDGPGVRLTVFLKGCPLSCLWCHNPESQAAGPEILLDEQKCAHCGRCGGVCPSGAAGRAAGGLFFDRSLCLGCGACAEACPAGARELAGTAYSVPQLMREIEKERPFFEQSGGGVTFSGGEPLLQAGFVSEAATACRARGISVAVDTSGFVPFDALERVAGVTDLFLFDLKHMDPALHRRYTGADNALILSNLKGLQALGAAVQLRLPLIAGINDGEAEIRAILDFISGMSARQVDLLPYHAIGRGKYKKLGRTYEGDSFRPPSDGRLEEIRRAFLAAGFQVTIGG